MNDSPLWTTLTSRERLTGTWRSAMPEYHNQPSPCLGACPVNGRIAEWIGQIRAGDIRRAWETLSDNNPFPAIAGRICHHPCETVCNRREMDETVGICSLERFAGDAAIAEGWAYTAGPDTGRSVAVIGGGPAGLSAAYQLRRRGIAVVLYEKSGALGGLMAHGIPSYRLDRAVLEAEIGRIAAMGVDVRLNAEIPDRAALEALRAHHDALYLATGASRPKKLPGLDYAQAFVIDSAEFLALPRAGQSARSGDRVLVVGGGSAAMDVARSARRLGRAVSVLTLEAEGRLPAQQTEIEEAIEEGIVFVCGAMLKTVEPGKDGQHLACVRVDFQAGAEPGQFRIDPIEGSDFALTADTIIPAIGQDADLARWAGLLDATGPVIAAGRDWSTGAPGIWAGGDVASMGRFVTQAVGMGKQAAQAIAAHLQGQPAPSFAVPPTVGYDRINPAYQDRHGRNHQELAPVAERLRGFGEVQRPLSADAAAAEAARCFSCGTCTYCNNCYFYCPDMAISRLDSGYAVIADYCKGCGLCVAECPTGAIHMTRDQG